jgi:hypothetical protein
LTLFLTPFSHAALTALREPAWIEAAHCAKQIGFVMIRVRGGLPRQRLPDEVYTELVDILFRAITPLISMAVLVTGIGAMMFWMTGDIAIALLTAGSFALTIARVWLNLAYRRRRGGGAMPIAEIRKWEWAFGAGVVLAAALLGLINVRALMASEVAVHMLVAALTFGFSAGAVIRLSVRPLVAGLTLIAVVSLTFVGFVTHAQTSDGQLALAYGGQALLLGVFALGSIEMVNHLYRTTLEQIDDESRTLAPGAQRCFDRARKPYRASGNLRPGDDQAPSFG